MRRKRKTAEPAGPQAISLPAWDFDGAEWTPHYEQLFVPLDDPWPRFAIKYHPRVPEQNDAQYGATRRDAETFARSMSVTLGTAWIAATHLGHHKTCREKACVRMRRCAGRFREDDWSTFPGPMYPPCADAAGVDAVRPLGNALIAILEEKMRPILARQIGRPRGGDADRHDPPAR